ncbi:hypothetical protein LTR62_008046 [Meristemomyces frigidus]|uniref:Uncharacterized protein n=1 Tax=Meristemomyces frigidus TaxID=1508187 RepID=A0AAN7TUX4_9PEZI|nr:hypothetical protein LTR62_008046 [Meristemomyces frigidus]
MDISDRVDGAHTTPSPCGRYLAYVQDTRLRVSTLSAPERHSNEFNIKKLPKEILSIIWSHDSNRLATVSHTLIEVLNVSDASSRVRLDNGGGGLGHFSSAVFLDTDHLLTIWEFGRGRIWNLTTGRSTEIGEVKTTCSGSSYCMRPNPSRHPSNILATLFRVAAEDVLSIHFVEQSKSMPKATLPSADAQDLSWSPDGRWLAVLDTPTASVNVLFYTPDGHFYRSYTDTSCVDDRGLGIKAIVWSYDCRKVALARYDGGVVLLNTKSFTILASIAHNTAIEHSALEPPHQAPIWREHVSATNERTYSLATHPVSPPLSRSKASTEPSELGVAEMSFSCSGEYLATRDERMQSTVWIWSTQTLSTHAIIIQHANIRSVQWHPTHPELLLLDCGESILYILEVTSSSPPLPITVPIPGTPALTWLNTTIIQPLTILAATKSASRLLFPSGRPTNASPSNNQPSPIPGAETPFDEDTSEDSIMDLLSGRPARSRRSEQSYTERIDSEENAAEETVRLDDTFRAKRRPLEVSAEVDPLDDSQIF